MRKKIFSTTSTFRLVCSKRRRSSLPARLTAGPSTTGAQKTRASGRDDTADEGQEDNSGRDDNSNEDKNEGEQERVEGFRAPGDPANTGELLKFLLDRTGYIKLLEQEDTPESLARIENLRELVNAAMDSRDRGESLSEFLDHAALVSDADDYDENARVTLMTLHAAKGLEFPLVFLIGLEEGLFPHSRTLLAPDDIEEERRLCYVGMTRAMDTLILSRARYRRRYGTDMPEAGVPSRFLEEVPEELLQDLGSPRRASHVSSDYGTAGTMPTKTRTSGHSTDAATRRSGIPTAGRHTTPSTTSRSFSPRAARSLPGQRSR
jgi:superfamily I DNA/RNA helicase